MQNTTTLYLLNKDTADDVIDKLAADSAPSNVHLSCLILGSEPTLPVAAYGVPPYGALNVPDDWGDQLEIAHQRQNEKVQEVEQILARNNVSGDVQSAFCVTSEIRHHVARKARVSDIVHIAANLRDEKYDWGEAIYGALFEAPVGLMLNRSPAKAADRIMIAWDSSKAASRAVHQALPYLKAASEVTIGCFDPIATATADGADPGTGLAAWLSHHGCKVTVSQFPSGGAEIADCIQDRAGELGADLVVMGAYGHARLLQSVFGGTTRSMIEQTETAVLLAH